MNKKKYVRLDADNVGDSIELLLLKGKYKEAQLIHTLVQNSMGKIREKISSILSFEILMFGSDDILFLFEVSDNLIDLLEEIRGEFFNSTGHTLSIGVGNSLNEAMQNLRIAKLSGKNKIHPSKKKRT